MSDSKSADSSRNAAAHKAETLAAVATNSPRQEPVSTATQYWLNVIAVGKAAKPAKAAKPGRQRGMRA